jgi:hypothetical protein
MSSIENSVPPATFAPVMQQYRFYKEPDGRWYIDLPQYIEMGGDKADLEMVAGADTFLNVIANGRNNVYAVLSDQPFDNADQLHRVEREIDSGSFYKLATYQQKNINDFEMWLCDVTAYVFNGKFPDIIYYSVVNVQ